LKNTEIKSSSVLNPIVLHQMDNIVEFTVQPNYQNSIHLIIFTTKGDNSILLPTILV